jgi:hypothetical protein
MQIKPDTELPKVAIGGFGHSISHHTQRIDVTGHVASAFIKLLALAASGNEE